MQRNVLSKESASINDLPVEIRMMIFTSLDAKALCSVGQTCKEALALTNDPSIWQNKIREHFPYLLRTNAKLYEENPEKAYIDEYKSYQKVCIEKKLNCSMRLVLAALSGNLSQIASAPTAPIRLALAPDGKVHKIASPNYLTANTKRQLYVWSAASGHQKALEKLDMDGKIDAFCFAVRKGQLQCVQHLAPMLTKENLDRMSLNFTNKQRYLATKDWALKIAAKKGYLAIAECLFQNIPDILLSGVALRATVRHGHLTMMQYLLERSTNILVDKEICFYEAGKNGQIEIVKYLFSSASDLSKNKTLNVAATNGYLEVVKYLLLQRSDTCVLNADAALVAAAKNQKFEIVKYLAEQQNIYFKDKSFAIVSAKKLGFLGTARDIENTINFRTTLQEGFKNFILFLKQLFNELRPNSKNFLFPGILTGFGWRLLTGSWSYATSVGWVMALASLMGHYLNRQFNECIASEIVKSPEALSTLTPEELKAVKTGIKSADSWKEWVSHIFDKNATKHFLCYRAGVFLKSQKKDTICDNVTRILKLKKQTPP